jgi:hypothetical protein
MTTTAVARLAATAQVVMTTTAVARLAATAR